MFAVWLCVIPESGVNCKDFKLTNTRKAKKSPVFRNESSLLFLDAQTDVITPFCQRGVVMPHFCGCARACKAL